MSQVGWGRDFANEGSNLATLPVAIYGGRRVMAAALVIVTVENM